MNAANRMSSFHDDARSFRRFGKSRRRNPAPSRPLRYEELESRRLLSTFYVSSSIGNNSYDGLYADHSLGGIHGPWKSTAKVNATSFSPDDNILFKRGDVFRGETLVACGGSSVARITYGAYGSGALPQILGSTEENATTDWRNLGGNIWATRKAVDLVTTVGSEMLPNPSFTASADNWQVYANSAQGATATGARTTTPGTYHSSPAGYRVYGVTNHGSEPTDIQLYTSNLSITAWKYYLLTFRAKCTSPFSLGGIHLIKNGTPYDYYTGDHTATSLAITGTWTTYKVLFRPNVTASDARLDFFLGEVMPEGSTFYIDTLSFKECVVADGQRIPTGNQLGRDAGNIIFNGGASCGTFKRNLGDLTTQGDFSTDPSDWSVRLYSTSNPATYYSHNIEIAISSPIITCTTGYVTFQDLDLRYGSHHGIDLWGAPGNPVHDCTVQRCDVSWIGGGVFNDTLRLGNGIQIWADSTNMLITNNRIWQIYDGGFSQENASGTNSVVTNTVFQNNVVWDCVMSGCSVGLHGTGSSINGFYVQNNTFVDAGYGWARAQRTDDVGFGLALFVNEGNTTANFVVLDNIYARAYHSDLYIATAWYSGNTGMTMDYNLYYTPGENDLVVHWYGNWIRTPWFFTSYALHPPDGFGEDIHSQVTTVMPFVDPTNNNYHLLLGSPAINQGVDDGVTLDFDGVTRPQGGGYDIGAYEYVFSTLGSRKATPSRTTTVRVGVSGSSLQAAQSVDSYFDQLDDGRGDQDQDDFALTSVHVSHANKPQKHAYRQRAGAYR